MRVRVFLGLEEKDGEAGWQQSARGTWHEAGHQEMKETSKKIKEPPMHKK